MEQLAIYPYNTSYAPIVRHQKLIHDMEIRSLISPKGWGLNNDCIKTYDEKLIVTDNFTTGIEKCTAVWFVNDADISIPKELLKAKLLEALKHNKRVLFTRTSHTYDEEIKDLIPIKKSIQIKENNYFADNENTSFFKINTPVIFVLGLSENTDKFEVQVALREQFMQKGYKVSSVSSRTDSAIVGMHPLPHFLFDSISEVEKIVLFNHLVKQIELDEKPEIIIIGIPGGVSPFSKNQHNHFGITMYEISNALSCDCAVFCSPYLDYSLDLKYFTKISNEIYGKFGFPIDYHHIAARTYDKWLGQPSDKDFNWVTLDESFIDSRIETYNRLDVFNLLCTHKIKELVEKLIKQLSEAPRVQSI